MGLSGQEVSFVQMMGRSLGTKSVLVTPGSRRLEREPQTFEALVQATKAFFDITTPVYDGDALEWDDPRGDRRTVFARTVKVNDSGGEAANLAHIAVAFDDDRREAASPSLSSSSVGHHIEIHGSNVNVAVDGSTITQQLSVPSEWKSLADSIGQALAVIERAPGVDEDEVELARETATSLIEEVTRDEPNRRVVKRLLPSLRGVLQSALNAGAAAGSAGLIDQLII